MAVCALSSCKKLTMEEAITKNIIAEAKANGFDFKPTIEEIQVIDTIRAKELVDNFYTENAAPDMPRDTVKARIQNMVKEQKELLKNQHNDDEKGGGGMMNESDQLIVLDGMQKKLDRLKKLESTNPSNPQYYVVKVKYKVQNPLMRNAANADVQMAVVYLITPNNHVVANATEQVFEQLQKQNTRTKTQKYEFLIETREMMALMGKKKKQ